MFHSNATTMKITESAVQLSAQHASVFQNFREERVTIRRQPQQRSEQTDSVELSEKAKAAKEEEENDAALDPAMRVAKQLLERLTGKKIRLWSSKDFEQKTDATNQPNNQTGNTTRAGTNLEYTTRETVYDAEAMAMEAKGVIKTADGRELSFSMSMSMTREFFSQTSTSVNTGTETDPLVINYDGKASDLTSRTFAFDLNTDGAKDQISFLKPGSGFLALDRNHDGKVNNGSELFGSKTGNGFEELRAYDDDGNNWIDENDAVYNELRVWAQDHGGKDSLHTLQHHQIGALFLGSTATPFSIRDSNNTPLGEVASSGVFLRENGTAGTIQQVNLLI